MQPPIPQRLQPSAVTWQIRSGLESSLRPQSSACLTLQHLVTLFPIRVTVPIPCSPVYQGVMTPTAPNPSMCSCSALPQPCVPQVCGLWSVGASLPSTMQTTQAQRYPPYVQDTVGRTAQWPLEITGLVASCAPLTQLWTYPSKRVWGYHTSGSFEKQWQKQHTQ